MLTEFVHIYLAGLKSVHLTPGPVNAVEVCNG
jgi:hypothetical protein